MTRLVKILPILFTASMLSPFFAHHVFAASCSELGGNSCLSSSNCQTLAGNTPGTQCVPSDDCTDDDVCWISPGVQTQVPAVSQSEAQQGAPAPTRIILPDCIDTGNCTLDDIVRTGVAFATFLFGLSAALFFAIFVYGGAMYLLSFGQSGMVERGKKAIKGAVIGFLLVMAAWSIVRFVDESLRGEEASAPASGTAATCTQLSNQGYACTSLTGNTPQTALQDASSKNLECYVGLCPNDPVNVLCCRSK